MIYGMNTVLDFAGAAVAIIFLFLNARAKRSLIGSFFKKYYWLMIAASASLFVGFFMRLPGAVELDPMTKELLHKLALLLFGTIAIWAAYILPIEASKYLKNKKI